MNVQKETSSFLANLKKKRANQATYQNLILQDLIAIIMRGGGNVSRGLQFPQKRWECAEGGI
ncbi:Uncharacterised protein [uncultured archaeon]|nr:Uncharacterised protein [uncultured archaeon]